MKSISTNTEMLDKVIDVLLRDDLAKGEKHKRCGEIIYLWAKEIGLEKFSSYFQDAKVYKYRKNSSLEGSITIVFPLEFAESEQAPDCLVHSKATSPEVNCK